MEISGIPATFFNYEEAMDRVGDDLEFLTELLEDFDEIISDSIQGLQDANEKDDPAKFSEIAHSIKGAAANLALKDINALCLQMEIDGKNGKLNQAQKNIDQLKSYLSVFKKLLIEIRNMN